jgi:hypothetical protein|nr:MAG TPA: hypothetical protein [Caudoviricetes sp.]
MVKYKIDVFAELKKKGYNQTRIQRERLLPAQTAQNIKAGKKSRWKLRKVGNHMRTTWASCW